MKKAWTILFFIFFSSAQLFAQNNEDALSTQRVPFSMQVRIGFIFVYIVLGLLFLMLFAFYPRQRLNLFFGLFNMCAFLMSINSQSYIGEPYGMKADINEFLSRLVGMNILLFMLYALNRMRPFFWWVIAFILFLDFPIYVFLGQKYYFINQVVHSLFTLICLWLLITAFKTKKREDWLIGFIAAAVVFINLSGNLLYFTKLDITKYAGLVPYVITISAVIYLALRYARANSSLEQQLKRVKNLSDENVRREQEKQELLAGQNVLLEQQVKQRTSEINAQKETLQNTLMELKSAQAQLIQSEKMASLGELTAGIAHEIQNPMNFVNNFSDVNTELVDEAKVALEKGNLDEVRAILNDLKDNELKINHHGKRADSIVKGMLYHSRTSSGQKEPSDINALCDEYLRLAYHGLRAKDKSFNAKFETDFDPSLPQINVVRQDMGRVILNLINNAFYAVSAKAVATADGNYIPTVIVSTRLSRDKIEIKVKDNGSGIPDKIKDKIFQPFFTTKPTGQGTGLGLSLAYDIVKAHGGEIKLSTSKGEASEFIIQLPL